MNERLEAILTKLEQSRANGDPEKYLAPLSVADAHYLARQIRLARPSKSYEDGVREAAKVAGTFIPLRVTSEADKLQSKVAADITQAIRALLPSTGAGKP